MRELFLSELRRFGKPAMIAAAAHLVLLLALSRMVALMQMDWHGHVLVLAIYTIAATGLGLYQFGTYRQPGRWIWLMHRPLPAARIFASIGAASALLVTGAIVLPAWLVLAGTQALTARVVDLHHYGVFVFAALFAVTAWLCGAYIMLNRSKLAAVLVLLPFLLLMHLANTWVMVAMALACVVLMAAIVVSAFKADRLSAPQGRAATICTALPLALALYFALLWGGSIVFQVTQMAFDVHPLNTARPPTGGVSEISRALPPETMEMGLKSVSDPRKSQWLRDLKRAVPSMLNVGFERRALRRELASGAGLEFSEDATGTTWTFSRDKMLFLGRDRYSGIAAGTLGRGGVGDQQPFSAVPDIWNVQAIAKFPQQEMQFDQAVRRFRAVMEVLPDEVLLDTSAINPDGREYALTTRRAIVHAGTPLREHVSIPLPGKAVDLKRLDIATVSDGVLAAFTFGRHMIDGLPGGAQITLFVDAEGKASEVGRRALTHDFGPLFEHKEWWLSPVLQALREAPGLLLDTGEVLPFNPLDLPRPPIVRCAAIACALLAALAAWWWSAATALTRRARIAWSLACLLLGLPAFLCLMLMQARTSPLAARSSPALQAT